MIFRKQIFDELQKLQKMRLLTETETETSTISYNYEGRPTQDGNKNIVLH